MQPLQATGFRTILRNSATLISARVVSKFAMTIFMIVLARRLGTADFGVFSSIVAFIAFFSLVEEFGLTPPMIRRVARSREEGPRILGEIVGLKVSLGVVAYALLMLTSIALGMSPLISAILGVSMVLEILAQTVTRIFEAYERMKDVAIVTIVERSVLCVAGVAAVWLTGSIAVVGIAYVVTFVTSLGIATWLFRRNIGPFRPAFNTAAWGPMMREAMPFLLAGILSTIWTRVDIYFLTSFRTPPEVGSYNAALRVVEAQIFIPVAILGSVFPVLARLRDGPRRDFNRVLGKNFIFLLITGIAAAAGTFVFAGQIISVLFGDQYADSAAILRIFSPMIMLSFLNYLISGALIAMGREILTTITLGLGAVICVTLGFLLIPVDGAPAAGLIKVIAEASTFSIQGAILLLMIFRSRLSGSAS